MSVRLSWLGYWSFTVRVRPARRTAADRLIMANPLNQNLASSTQRQASSPRDPLIKTRQINPQQRSRSILPQVRILCCLGNEHDQNKIDEDVQVFCRFADKPRQVTIACRYKKQELHAIVTLVTSSRANVLRYSCHWR